MLPLSEVRTTESRDIQSYAHSHRIDGFLLGYATENDLKQFTMIFLPLKIKIKGAFSTDADIAMIAVKCLLGFPPFFCLLLHDSYQ